MNIEALQVGHARTGTPRAASLRGRSYLVGSLGLGFRVETYDAGAPRSNRELRDKTLLGHRAVEPPMRDIM